MGRGITGAPALDMSKWFNTNYHYMVPELDGCKPTANFDEYLSRVRLGQQTIGKDKAVPYVVGPVTLVERASKTEDLDTIVNRLIPVYNELFVELKKLGVNEVCVHEPSVVLSNTGDLQKAIEKTYNTLSKAGLKINLVS
jgi:5-methyltetrahydropteroyltriglutamate--homocysteine methyltransferase